MLFVVVGVVVGEVTFGREGGGLGKGIDGGLSFVGEGEGWVGRGRDFGRGEGTFLILVGQQY